MVIMIMSDDEPWWNDIISSCYVVCVTDQITLTYPNLCARCKSIAPEIWRSSFAESLAPPAKGERSDFPRAFSARFFGSIA